MKIWDSVYIFTKNSGQPKCYKHIIQPMRFQDFCLIPNFLRNQFHFVFILIHPEKKFQNSQWRGPTNSVVYIDLKPRQPLPPPTHTHWSVKIKLCKMFMCVIEIYSPIQLDSVIYRTSHFHSCSIRWTNLIVTMIEKTTLLQCFFIDK